MKRQMDLAEQEPEDARHANFGSWNSPHLTTYDKQAEKYVLMADETERIRVTGELLQTLESTYRDFARKDKYFVEIPNRVDDLMSRLMLLGSA